MTEKIKSEMISRRMALGLVAALGFVVPALMVPDAEAQTPGMERRQERRTRRHVRREDRREGRAERREDRRKPAETTGKAPAEK